MNSTQKFFKYILTHFKIKTSHPEETEAKDRGVEIRWTFFNLAFLKKPEVKIEKKDPESIDND